MQTPSTLRIFKIRWVGGPGTTSSRALDEYRVESWLAESSSVKRLLRLDPRVRTAKAQDPLEYDHLDDPLDARPERTKPLSICFQFEIILHRPFLNVQSLFLVSLALTD